MESQLSFVEQPPRSLLHVPISIAILKAPQEIQIKKYFFEMGAVSTVLKNLNEQIVLVGRIVDKIQEKKVVYVLNDNTGVVDIVDDKNLEFSENEYKFK